MKRWGVAIGALVVAVIAVGIGLVVFGPSGGDDDEAAAGEPEPAARFDDCDDLLEGLRARAMAEVGPYGLQGVAFGTTNSDSATVHVPTGAGQFGVATVALPAFRSGAEQVQVQDGLGVVIAGESLLVLDVSGPEPEVLGRARLGPLTERSGSTNASLVLSGGRALVVSGDHGGAPDVLGELSAEPLFGATGPPATLLALVDLGDPSAPVVLERMWVQGAPVAVRGDGDRAEVVIATGTSGFDFLFPSGPAAEEAALEANREVLARSTLEDWLPVQALVDSDGRVAGTGFSADCSGVVDPGIESGLGALTFYDLDLTTTLAEARSQLVLGLGAVSLDEAGADVLVTEVDGRFAGFEGVNPAELPPPSTHVLRLERGASGLEAVARIELDGTFTSAAALHREGERLHLALLGGVPWLGPALDANIVTLERQGGTLVEVASTTVPADERGILRIGREFAISYSHGASGDETHLHRRDGDGWQAVELDHEVGRLVELGDGRWLTIGWDDEGAVVALLEDGPAELVEVARWTSPRAVLGSGPRDAVHVIGGSVTLSTLLLGNGPVQGAVTLEVDEGTVVEREQFRLEQVAPDGIGESDCREAEPGEVPLDLMMGGMRGNLTLVCEPGQVGGAVGHECFHVSLGSIVRFLDGELRPPGMQGIDPASALGLSEEQAAALRRIHQSGARVERCAVWGYDPPEPIRAFAALDGGRVGLAGRRTFGVRSPGGEQSAVSLEPVAP